MYNEVRVITIDIAKEHLSSVYPNNDWKQQLEYYQRLYILNLCLY